MENKIIYILKITFALLMSLLTAWLGLVITNQFRISTLNQQYFELSKMRNKEMENKTHMIYIYTVIENSYDKARLIHLSEEKKCVIISNQIVYKSNIDEVWEINCEK